MKSKVLQMPFTDVKIRLFSIGYFFSKGYVNLSKSLNQAVCLIELQARDFYQSSR